VRAAGTALSALMVAFVDVMLGALPVQVQPPRGSEYSQVDIEAGSRLYAAHCVDCHGRNGDLVGTVNLRSGQFRRASTDQELNGIITNGIRDAGMPPHSFTQPELVAVVAYIRNMRDFDGRSVALGDAGRGKVVFEGTGGCTGCHRVNGDGSRVAPDLSDIGSLRAASALERSLVEPTSAMLPINRQVRLVTKQGQVINGRRLNEDTFTIQILDSQERLLSLEKANLREYGILKNSTMPSYKDKLSSAELADLVAFLVSLKGS
jgi:putative heme-binding domain-containing protein